MIPFYWLIPFSITIGCVSKFIRDASQQTGNWAAMGVLVDAIIPAFIAVCTWGVFFFCLWVFGG